MRVLVNDNIFKVRVCMTPETIQRGMMGQKFNQDFNGMLFMMPQNGDHSFWMKDCITPLDIVFMDQNRKITSIHKNCPECKQEPCENYNGSGQYVLELPAGTCDECGIEEGPKIKLTF